ncbi:hypothetical protein M0804_004822 [Polistes exclamans]|nr:hypothetical protein M0804_004822 [Polistes exclamans]
MTVKEKPKVLLSSLRDGENSLRERLFIVGIMNTDINSYGGAGGGGSVGKGGGWELYQDLPSSLIPNSVVKLLPF